MLTSADQPHHPRLADIDKNSALPSLVGAGDAVSSSPLSASLIEALIEDGIETRQIRQRRSQPRRCSMRLFNVGLSTAMNLGEVDLFDKLEMIPCGGHLAAAGGIPSSQEWSR